MEDRDHELVALIDKELAPDARNRLLSRIKEDEELGRRYEALQKTSAPLAAAFDQLLLCAPLDRLRAAIPKEEAPRQHAWRLGNTLRAPAAGIVIGVSVAGIGAWTAMKFAAQEEQEDWRSAVVEYMELYTNETFALDEPDPSALVKKLTAIGGKLNVHLAPEDLAISGLRLKAAQLLSYDGAPLAEIAYVDAQGAPILFCIIGGVRGRAAPESEKRGDLSLASWSDGAHGYLVIGRLPEQPISDLAKTLERRFSKT
jgi:anti-sigma factor RsiW